MESLFTFDRMGPKNYTLQQLQATCRYLELKPSKCKDIDDYIDLLLPYFYNVPNRIGISYHHRMYYMNVHGKKPPLASSHGSKIPFKSVKKTYEDNILKTYTTTYHTSFRTVDRIFWKSENNHDDLYNRFRKVYQFLDLQNLYLLLYYMCQHNMILKDIGNYIFYVYHTSMNQPIYYTIY